MGYAKWFSARCTELCICGTSKWMKGVFCVICKLLESQTVTFLGILVLVLLGSS